jgi:uncharacterized metal-binding protein
MPSLPQRKVGIVACSGEEMAEGTVTRLAALKVLEELRPAETVTICLPLFLAGGEGDRAFAKFYPTIAVDGCEKRCAARATELYSNKPAASIVLDDLLAERGLPRPQGLRRLTPESQPIVDALAEAIAAEVDQLMASRWSRAEGKVLEPETPAKVSSAGCACGSGIPVTRVQVNGRAVEIMALEPILEMAYGQVLARSEIGNHPGGTGQSELPVPAQLMDTVRLYNTFPAEDDVYYAEAVRIAWHSFCAAKEQPNG